MFGGAGKQSETVERMLASAQSYAAMIQSMFRAQNAGAGSASANPSQAWLDSLRGGFAAPNGFRIPGMDAGLTGSSAFLDNPFTKALRDISGQGAKGFTEMPAAFAPFVEQMRQEGLSWLRAPAFGVGREHQEHYQKTALAFVEYSQALQNYNALMLKASQRGFELFEGKLAERSEPGRAIDSLRALYDLWVDAAEEAYAEIALSDEFAKVYGELANAQMRVRAQIQAEVERVGTDLGMPTRSELNSVHKRLHDLRRELRDGGRATQADGSAPQAEIVTLHAKVKELKHSSARVRQSAATPVPKAVAAAPPAGKQSPPPARARRRVPAKPRASAPVVRPRPVAVSSRKSADTGKTTFGDAIAAMRRRVVGKPGKHKAVAAGMSKPSRQNKSASAKPKAGKRKH